MTIVWARAIVGTEEGTAEEIKSWGEPPLGPLVSPWSRVSCGGWGRAGLEYPDHPVGNSRREVWPWGVRGLRWGVGVGWERTWAGLWGVRPARGRGGRRAQTQMRVACWRSSPTAALGEPWNLQLLGSRARFCGCGWGCCCCAAGGTLGAPSRGPRRRRSVGEEEAARCGVGESASRAGRSLPAAAGRAPLAPAESRGASPLRMCCSSQFAPPNRFQCPQGTPFLGRGDMPTWEMGSGGGGDPDQSAGGRPASLQPLSRGPGAPRKQRPLPRPSLAALVQRPVLWLLRERLAGSALQMRGACGHSTPSSANRLTALTACASRDGLGAGVPLRPLLCWSRLACRARTLPRTTTQRKQSLS